MASGSNVTLNVGANLNPANLVRQLNQVQAQHGTFNMTLNTKGFRQPLGRITGDLGEFQNALDASIARTLAFGAAVGVVNGVANAFKTMVSSAIDVEKKLADINVILNESQKGLADFSNKLFEVAKNTGQSFDAVSDAAVELARQGLGAEETLKRINDAMILTRLSGMDAAKSVETLTAAVNGFGQSAITTTQLVNKLATVDAAFAVSTEDLANALSRAGSSAQAAKVDLNQLLAAVTSVQQQTARGGAVIGNAFKSIFTRLQRSGVREALEEIGVATTDAAGNIRGALSILKDYAGVYSSLTDQQRAYTDELVAGVFQINNLKALVKDLGSGFSIYDRALSQSANATDEATRRNRALGETLSSLVNEASVNVKALAASLGNLVATPAIQNLLKMFNSISEALVKALDPEQGSRLIKGMFTGIGNFIAGPGLIIVGAAFVKLFKFITGQSVRALKEVFKINTAAQKTKQIEAELAVILANNTQLYQQISNQSLTRQQREQMVLNAINAETVAYKQQAVILAQLARSRVVGAGVGARSRAGAGGRSRAEGFVPNYVNEVEGAVASERAAVSAGVGGASQGAQAKVLPGFPVGGGRKETMVANTDEVIAPNFGGGQGSAIFNPDMIKTMGMPEGAIPVSSSGFVPNYNVPGLGVAGRGAAIKPRTAGKALTAAEKKQIVSERIKAYLGVGIGGPSWGDSDVGQAFGVIASAGTKTKSGKVGGKGDKLGLGADSDAMKAAFRNDGGLIDGNSQNKLARKLASKKRNFKGIAQTPIMPITEALETEVEQEAKQGKVVPINFESIIGKPIANAIGNISSTMYSRLLGDDAKKADILKGIKSNIEANSAEYAKSGGKILSSGAEGAMLELAVRFGAQGAKKTIGSQSDSAIWDFEESGPIDSDIKAAFFNSDSNMARADGKRSGGDSAWRSALQKSINDPRFIPAQYSPAEIFESGYREEVQNILTGKFGGKSRRGKRGRQVGDTRNILTTTKGSASGFIPNFAQGGVSGSVDAAVKNATDAKKATEKLNLDFGELVVDIKELKRSSSAENLINAGSSQTGIRGASGFVPSFASALEESITREKDALAAQGSDAKVYTGQDDRLKGSKNPAGLLVANTRDEPRSGSQGVDRMLGAGRNPKTGGSAEGYVPNFAGPLAVIGGGIKKTLGGLGAAFSKLATTLFAVEIALSVLNPILEQYGYQAIPTVTDGIKILLDRFFGVDRAMVNLAETARKTAETEIKALTQSIEKVDAFTSSVSKLSNAIDAGNVDTMGEFLKSTLEQANKVENIDLGSIFANLGDQQAMSKAAEDIKAAASAEVSLKQLGGELAAIAKKFQETRKGARDVGDALKKTGNSYKNLSKSLIAGQSLEDMKSSLDRINKSAAIGSSGVRQLVDTFPELSHESAMFIATTGDMGPELAKATKQQLRYQIAVAELTKQMEESAGKVPEIKQFGDDLVRLGEGITSASNATVSAINSLNEVGSIEAASRVEGLQATGTVSKGAVLQGAAAGESTRVRDKTLQDQKESLEKFGVAILKSSEGDGLSLEGPLKALVEGIASGNTNAAASLGVLEEISKGSGANADTAKATINELIKINTTQISSQAKIEATLRANLDKLNNQAVAFQRNNVLSQQQIDQFSEFSNTLNKDGETEKSQLQKLTELKGVMSTVESLIGDDDVLAELKEQTSQLTQLENLRGTFEALTGQEFDGGSIRELQGQIESFISRGQTQDLEPIKKDLFYALKEALDTAVSVGQPGVSTAGDVEAAATVKIDPTSLAELSAKMSQAIGEESAAALGVNSDILQSLNTSLEKNVGEIAASIAQQSIDNEAGIKKRNEINEKISKILKDSLGGIEISSDVASLTVAAKALEKATANLAAGTSASGFVPNFSPQDPVARAANTERAMGGRPVVDHQKGVGTYVRDGKTQKNFSDVRRDHPEGIGRAIKNSRSIQGAGAGFVPNFAGILGPVYIKDARSWLGSVGLDDPDAELFDVETWGNPFSESAQSKAFMEQRAYGQPPPTPAELFNNYLNGAKGKQGNVAKGTGTGAGKAGWYQQYGNSAFDYSVKARDGMSSNAVDTYKGRAELYYGPIANEGKAQGETGFVEWVRKWTELARNFETAGAIVPEGNAGGARFAKIYSGGFSNLTADQISAQSRTVSSPYSDDEFIPTLPYIFPPEYENYYNKAAHVREAAERNGNSPASARADYTSNPIIRSNAGAFKESAYQKLRSKYDSEFAGGASSQIGLISQMEASKGFISSGRGVTLETVDQAVAGQQNQDWGGWVPFAGEESGGGDIVEMLRSANRLGDLDNLFGKLSEPIPNGGRLNIPIPEKQHALWDDYRNLRALTNFGLSRGFNVDSSHIGAPIWKKDSLLARAYGMFEADKFADKFSDSDDGMGFYIPVGGLKPTQDGYESNEDLTPWTLSQLREASAQNEINKTKLREKLAGGLSRAGNMSTGLQVEHLNKFGAQLNKYIPFYESTKASASEGVYPKELGHPSGDAWSSNVVRNVDISDPSERFDSGLDISRKQPQNVLANTQEGFANRLKETGLAHKVEAVLGVVPSLEEIQEARATWTNREERARDQENAYEVIRNALVEEAETERTGQLPIGDVDDPAFIPADWDLGGLEESRASVAPVLDQFQENLNLPPIPQIPEVQADQTPDSLVRDNIYRALMQKPVDLVGDAFEKRAGRKVIENAYKYKQILSARRDDLNKRLNKDVERERKFTKDTPDRQRLLERIKARKRKLQVLDDDENGLAFLYSKGFGAGIPNQDGVEFWNKTYNEGFRFDRESIGGGESPYKKMVDKYFNGRAPQGTSPADAGNSLFGGTGELGSTMTADQYLQSFHSYGIMNAAGTSEIIDFARARGLGNTVPGLEGEWYRNLIESVMDSGRSTAGGGMIRNTRREGGKTPEKLFKAAGAIEVSDIAQDVRNQDADGGIVYESVRKQIRDALIGSAGDNNPRAKYVIDNLSFSSLMKSSVGKSLMDKSFSSGAPIWDFSNMFGGDFEAEKENVLGDDNGLQTYKASALSEGDLTQLRAYALRTVMNRWDEFNNPDSGKDGETKAGAEGWLSDILTNVDKERAERYPPYVASLSKSNKGSLFQTLLGEDPINKERWKLKYGEGGLQGDTLINKYTNPKQTAYGQYNPYKKGPEGGNALTPEQITKGKELVSNIDQGRVDAIHNLLYGNSTDPFQLDSEGADPQTAALSPEQAKEKLIKEMREYSKGKGLDVAKKYAPFGYLTQGRKTPTGLIDGIKEWLEGLRETTAPEEPAPPVASRGFVPNFSAIAGEIAASQTAGYKTPVTAGQVKTMNIPGAGKTAYNTQESVFRKPGVSQPFIAPPSNSKAASGYKKAVQSKFNFDPYGSSASGFVPNFAGMDMTLITEASYAILEAAKIFGDRSKSIEDSAKLLADAGVQMGQKYTDNIRPLTAATKSLMNSIAGISIPDSIEVSAGSLGSQMSALSSALGNVSGQIAVEVNVPDVSVQVAADSAGEQISTTIVEIMQQVIPGIVRAQLNTEETRNVITAEVNKELGLSA